ncbi:Troponin C, isoform 1 [Eumeta japonica]|uniref:Troponin C, isoform 1 n=1 Tax=Eumeta variegata TaxID=151549 RepID=A0A4C1UEZ7_EUMVA|nr:Troponin C, isoform 1 [Eumeta japonica]
MGAPFSVKMLIRSGVVSTISLVLRKAFEAFDHEKKGCIGTVMVGTILGMLGHQVTDETLKEIIEEVDEDGSGELEFEEFVTLASRFMVEEDTEAMQQELKEAFRLYDKEGNGYITTAVLREILRELDDKISAEELDMMIEEIDSDGSGTVDFDVSLFDRDQQFLVGLSSLKEDALNTQRGEFRRYLNHSEDVQAVEKLIREN